ncbi:glycosyltransferase family 4 protein [uncultured Tessaracoccus sp.]|uniref:glycosyltransferase family 4 protein n=1 Tax=uncultured Tessaracoccus sp. TaxID=905023 RepID=UPI002615AFFC|nr:glycosyltransferase family 4 protein [uncultured Tessaracoccus sp.]
MKIGIVCPYSFDQPGGVGTHVRGLAHWLHEQGHGVLVVAPGTGSSKPGEMLVGDSVPLQFNGSTAHLALAPAQARRAIAALREADVVHVHEPLTPGLSFAAARACRPLVVTHHAQFAPGLLTPLLRMRSAMIGRRVSLAVSDGAAATALAATGAHPDVIPNGIALPEENDKPTSQLPVVLYVGRRDDARKGYPIFEAVAERMSHEARFVALGPGRVSSHHIAEYGAVTDAERNAWLHEASVLVAPNTFGESFGLVLVEALAHGCGVVASDLPTFRAVADDPRCMSWFPPGDVEAATEALRKRLTVGGDASIARELAARYSWEHIGPRIVAAYEQARAQ